jgi:hypothetical protein
MGNEKDVFEWRRFGHWESSAAKARFAAFVLWHMADDSRYVELAHAASHKSDDARLGLLEAFRRESAVALELVVKAVVASKLIARAADPSKEGVPATHDLPRLWSHAGLPALGNEDKYRLQLVKSVLMWSGRYPTPRTVKAWEDQRIRCARGFLAHVEVRHAYSDRFGLDGIRSSISSRAQGHIVKNDYPVANAAMISGVFAVSVDQNGDVGQNHDRPPSAPARLHCRPD